MKRIDPPPAKGRNCLVPVVLATVLLLILTAPAFTREIRYYETPKGSHPHDVAPAADGTVWYTAQSQGALGRLNPRNGRVEQIPLGGRSSPHGVIVGLDGAAWVTDSGLNAIVRVDPATKAVKAYALPAKRDYANLNTATFDAKGIFWFTGQNGVSWPA